MIAASSLFARDLQVALLASGSKGNCTWIGDGRAGVLIDCGISARQVLARLDQLGMADAPIDAVLITHEHSDHVGAARVLCDKLQKRNGRAVPFYMTRGTADALRPEVRPSALETVEPGKSFRVRHLELDPFSVPHDTQDPVGWRVGSGGTWAGVVTDLGRSTALVQAKLSSLAIAVLEFNHDIELLLAGSYPWALKQRIRSSHGHLSNEQGAALLGAAVQGQLRHVLLGHLSAENNSPERAMAAAAAALASVGATGDVQVQIGWQDRPSPPATVRVHDW